MLFKLSLRTLRLYQLCDLLSGPLIYLILICGVWVLGTTRIWIEWMIDYLCYGLGVLLAVKLAIRLCTGFRNARWDERARSPDEPVSSSAGERRFLNRALGLLTALILGYILLTVVNAGSAYRPADKIFDYFKCLSWLPHSYDRTSGWFAFCNYSALAILFWGVHDWVVGKTQAEERADRARFGDFSGIQGRLLPSRMRNLFWVLTINGGLIAAEGIVQRACNESKLLFFFPPIHHQLPVQDFGPFGYRANAAQYFNLLWPLALGFWWLLEREARSESRRGRKAGFAPRHLALIAAGTMAAAPAVATTRAGVAVDIAMAIVAGAILLTAKNKDYRAAKLKLIGGLGLAAALAVVFGWNALANRLTSESLDLAKSQREYIYEIARPMAKDYPWFGTGPGTFETLYWAYQVGDEEFTVENLHDDWLETLITFGWIGSALIALAFCTVLVRWFVRGGIHGGIRLVSLIWLSLAGCLAHGRYDFPLQIHSILAIFLVLCSILFSLSRGSSR